VTDPIAADIEQVLLSEEQIAERLRTLAKEVDRDYAGRQIVLVGVLKGAFILMADLAR
jgi:hypoxanthine phosphoribosyltransferase